MSDKDLTAMRLREVLDYCPETGAFIRRATPLIAQKMGMTVGYINDGGYLRIRVDGKVYPGHRLAWLYVHGKFPNGELDHINRNRSDNRIANLRLATRSENKQNRSMQRNNKSGYRGVHWNGRDRRWHAQIQLDGKRHHLGSYQSSEDAYAAYCAAASELHTCNPFAPSQAKAGGAA